MHPYKHNTKPVHKWRIIEWRGRSDTRGYAGWVLCRDDMGRPMEFSNEADARDALRVMRSARLPGTFRLHYGSLTTAKARAQGHRVTPPQLRPAWAPR